MFDTIGIIITALALVSSGLSLGTMFAVSARSYDIYMMDKKKALGNISGIIFAVSSFSAMILLNSLAIFTNLDAKALGTLFFIGMFMYFGIGLIGNLVSESYMRKL